MKKFTCFAAVMVIAAVLTSCSYSTYQFSDTSTDTSDVGGYMISEELPSVMLSQDEYSSFALLADQNSVQCPHSELFEIENALAKKASSGMAPVNHTYDFFGTGRTVNADKLLETVKKNNSLYRTGTAKHFYEEPPEQELLECCRIVTDTVNWGIENIENFDYGRIGCMLGNLKILYNNSMNFGSYEHIDNVLKLSPAIIETANTMNESTQSFEQTVQHEAMHILQCRCADVECGEDDVFIGVSYSFEELGINPLRTPWMYEAAAELCSSQKSGTEPMTYKSIIRNLNNIKLAAVTNGNVAIDSVEKASFTLDETGLLAMLGFGSDTDAYEFLYAIQLMYEFPDDFRAVYESKFGACDDETFRTYIRDTYTPYVWEVLTKMFYNNLALSLTRDMMTLNDVFYLISVYESDLLESVQLGSAGIREQHRAFADMYLNLQNSFFTLVQNHTEANVTEMFASYEMNYGDGVQYANAALNCLSSDRRDFVLKRNNALYTSYHKSIAEHCAS